MPEGPGVYEILDDERAVQYVSYSTDVVADIKAHLQRQGEPLCSYARIKLFKNASMATPENMAREAEHWLEEAGGVLPPGNGVDAVSWALSQPAAQDAQPANYEDAKKPVVSPFTKAPVHRAVGQNATDAPLSIEAVDQVLDDVRGYLQTDGGDVQVVKVEGSNVFLRFEGNCATCSSQETTMRMGVERALRAAFGDRLREVIAMDPVVEGAPVGVTKKAIDNLLGLLRPAVQNYGGSVEVASLEGGVATIEYNGPEPIWVGVRAAIRDKFPEIVEVKRA